MSHVIVFLFKQKTAYEMRISYWSSDVCSSDLQSARPCRTCPRAPTLMDLWSPPRQWLKRWPLRTTQTKSPMPRRFTKTAGLATLYRPQAPSTNPAHLRPQPLMMACATTDRVAPAYRAAPKKARPSRRPEERRVGTEMVRQWSTRWLACYLKKEQLTILVTNKI